MYNWIKTQVRAQIKGILAGTIFGLYVWEFMLTLGNMPY